MLLFLGLYLYIVYPIPIYLPNAKFPTVRLLPEKSTSLFQMPLVAAKLSLISAVASLYTGIFPALSVPALPQDTNK